MTTTPRQPIEIAINTTNTMATSRLNSGVAYLVKRMANSWKRWQSHRTMTKLVTLDNHMLKDLGLTRGDVRLAASLPYSEDPTTRLKILAIERRASERAWAKEVHARRSVQSAALMNVITDQYRSSDNRDNAHC